MTILSEPNPFFNALMAGVSDEVMLIEIANMQVVDASDSLLRRLGCDLSVLSSSELEPILGTSVSHLREFVGRYQEQFSFEGLPALERDSNRQIELGEYVAEILQHGDDRYILLMKNDLSSTKNTMEALDESELRFQALVNNTPGLVFEFQLDDTGGLYFNYLSEGCKVLLGVSAEDLKRNPRILLNMINTEDIDSLQESIQASVLEFNMFNWEGRVWIEAWQDTKWINIRAVPRRLSNGQLLWSGMMTNITQSRNERFELEESRRQLAELSAHAEQVKEQERKRIAREIHDDLGGNLTAIKIGLSSAIKKIDASQAQLIEKMKYLEMIVNETFDVAHRISSDLRPNILDLGIVAALEWQAQTFEKQIGIPCTFSTNHVGIAVNMDEAITLFRICQEAMSNIAKHAHAQNVTVSLNRERDGLVMTIADDGVGLQGGDVLKSNSFGLRGMNERVIAVNGEFSIENGEHAGTQITVKLPFSKGHIMVD